MTLPAIPRDIYKICVCLCVRVYARFSVLDYERGGREERINLARGNYIRGKMRLLLIPINSHVVLFLRDQDWFRVRVPFSRYNSREREIERKKEEDSLVLKRTLIDARGFIRRVLLETVFLSEAQNIISLREIYRTTLAVSSRKRTRDPCVSRSEREQETSVGKYVGSVTYVDRVDRDHRASSRCNSPLPQSKCVATFCQHLPSRTDSMIVPLVRRR